MVAAACRRAAAASPSTDTAMLCCGRKKDGQHEQTTEMAASPRRQGADPGPQAPPTGPSTSSTTPVAMRQKDFPPMVVQSDFRKVSGISTEIFRQIETVENDHDATTAAALEAVERRGEMLVRILDPRHMGKAASEAARAFLTVQDPKHVVHFVEIVKRPGQTLGLYIREGNGIDRSDGVFISRIALESPVYNSGCLRVGDEILAVNLVDVTRMSLDDVVIIMSIPRRLVLTTRQRRGPPGAMSPPPPRPEHKPPPVVVLKRGLDEEPMDDTTSTSNSNGDRAYQQMGPSARLLASGRPLPGMADLPVHGTFPRNGERSDRDRFREREAGRYPERSAMNEEPRYFDQSLGLGRSQYEDQFKSPAQRFKSATLDRSGGYDLGMDLSQVATYQPPPPPSVVTEQPKPGAPQHFHPFERNYPKTLESLAERVHPFYGLQGPGALNLAMSQQGQGQAIGRASTLGRVRMPPNVASGVSQQMRGGRLLRSGSDQRLPVVEGTSEFYEYIMSRAGQTRSSLKPGTMQHYPVGRQGSADSARVPAPRRRTSVDYASDTEASTRQQRSAFPRRPVPGYAVEESWRPPATLGIGVTPTTSTMSFTSQEASSRSNSLPRDRGGRYRRGVRFEKELGGSATQQDSQDDSDGAISAPEMSSSQQQQQQQLQKSILDLQQPASFHGRLPDTPSVFTSAEYKAWLQRTPSTSAIYEQLRQGRDASEAQKAAKFTFSAENLMDKTRQEPPYYSYRSHFSTLQQDDNLLAGLAGGGRPPLRTAEEPRGIPQPTPGRTAAEPRFKLIDINPAEFIKYRSERPNGATPTSNQPGNTNTVGVAPATPGPGPAPGGTEEGVSGLLWVHLLAGRSLRSTSSRAEPVRDLYCVLESDRVHKARTVIRNGDVNFDWDETFDLDLVVNKELDFLIYSWDPQLRHRLCFKGSLHLIPLLRESPVHQIALKVEPRGTLYLKLRYTEPRAAFRRTPAARKTPPPLFGIDIETVVNREGSGLGVPIIIQKCVEEVERRGMDIVGLYRLCGSATKKRILREAFERNPRLVDLSPDSVPDINVITGLLKEYLRELPEPLFTKCLYQMLVDALAVCLPDDPEGNAKLMFSILECLPKSSRTTLFLLMDHLCLVAAQSDRNKMTPQNLAICFGPVLMLHSDDVTSLDFQKPIGVLKYLVQIWPMKSARAAEAAATASLTLRRLQGPPPSQQQQVTPTSAAVAVSSNPQQVTAGPEVPPLPPRPAPRTLQPRAGQTKAQHALGVFAAAGDVIAARGEADGSPAPMAEFLAALDSAAANSEDATPASSVTPSLTSPTSTSTSTTTTSASPLQPLVRGIAEGQRSRDCSDHSAGSKKSGGAGNGSSVRKDLTRGAINTEEDTEQEADSDLDSPN